MTSGNRLARLAAAALFALLVFGSGLAGPADAADEPIPGRMAIRAGRVIPVVGAPIDDGVILIRDGKIEAVGPASKISVPEGYELRHYPNGFVTPGWVELHAHVAGSDLNDMVYPTNPELRNLDNIVPDNFQLRAARAGGVTTMLFIPGSGTNLSGFGTLVKTAGATVEEIFEVTGIDPWFLRNLREIVEEEQILAKADPQDPIDVIIVPPGSAVAEAGVAVGDVLVSIDGTPVPDRATVSRMVAAKRWGDRIVLGMEREGDPYEATVVFRRR